ncbi:MAG: discoidin domain-containing protein [Candidatus Omnitrophota bacterium]
MKKGIGYRVLGIGFKKIALIILTMCFVFTNVSCAAQNTKDEGQGTVDEKQVSAADPKPQVPAPELVYLKIGSASASGFDESPDWAPKPDAMAAADGNAETRWASAYKDNEWIVFDFGKPKLLSRVVIKWEQAFPTRYEVLSSDDGQNWKRAALMEGQKGGVSEIDFQPVTARHIKVVGLERANQEWGISIWELEPYGPKAGNPDEAALGDTFRAIAEKTESQKKVDMLRDKMAAGYKAPSPGAIGAKEFQRGVNYTSWDKDELDTTTSDYSLAYLSEIGVGHVALMTVWYQDTAESGVIAPDAKKSVSDGSVAHAINMCHALGMKVMLKPHVDLIDEEARTNIIPGDEWFRSYREFILHYAVIAEANGVELLCIGTELSNTTTTRWKDAWLALIKDIRAVYKGALTYAANWDEYETVSFWDAVDYIGMDAYFPLTDKNDPPKEELVAAWTRHADILEKWLKDNNLTKGVIFTEVGYDTIEGSNKQPWRILPTLATYAESQDEQANCLESLFAGLSNRSWFRGFYWWNYFPRSDIGSLGYTLRGKKGEAILKEWFGKLK